MGPLRVSFVPVSGLNVPPPLPRVIERALARLAVVCSAPPFNVTPPLALPRLPSDEIDTVPALIVVPPPKLFCPVNMRVPVPCLIRPPLPWIVPAKFDRLAVPNVSELAPRLIDAPPMPKRFWIVWLPLLPEMSKLVPAVKNSRPADCAMLPLPTRARWPPNPRPVQPPYVLAPPRATVPVPSIPRLEFAPAIVPFKVRVAPPSALMMGVPLPSVIERSLEKLVVVSNVPLFSVRPPLALPRLASEAIKRTPALTVVPPP